jgi:hypothetical protein
MGRPVNMDARNASMETLISRCFQKLKVELLKRPAIGLITNVKEYLDFGLKYFIVIRKAKDKNDVSGRNY